MSSSGKGQSTMRTEADIDADTLSFRVEAISSGTLQKWDGFYTRDSVAATLFSQLMYELAKATFEDELGEVQFKNLLRTRSLDLALPLLVADAKSPWWDNVNTPQSESRFETARIAWAATYKHLSGLYGSTLLDWRWGAAHTLTHNHPLGQQKPLDRLFSTGPLAAPGGREIPNALGSSIGPAPWAVTYGPSTRRLIDFADPTPALRRRSAPCSPTKCNCGSRPCSGSTNRSRRGA